MATTQSTVLGQPATQDAAISLVKSKTETFLNALSTTITKDHVVKLITEYISDAGKPLLSFIKALQQQQKITGSSTLEYEDDDLVSPTEMKTKIQALVARINGEIVLLERNPSEHEDVPTATPQGLQDAWLNLVAFSKLLSK